MQDETEAPGVPTTALGSMGFSSAPQTVKPLDPSRPLSALEALSLGTHQQLPHQQSNSPESPAPNPFDDAKPPKTFPPRVQQSPQPTLSQAGPDPGTSLIAALLSLQALPPELLAQRALYINSIARDLLEIANSGRSETARIAAAKELNLMFQVTPGGATAPSGGKSLTQNNFNFPQPDQADPATAALLRRFSAAAGTPDETLDALAYEDLSNTEAR